MKWIKANPEYAFTNEMPKFYVALYPFKESNLEDLVVTCNNPVDFMYYFSGSKRNPETDIIGIYLNIDKAIQAVEEVLQRLWLDKP